MTIDLRSPVDYESMSHVTEVAFGGPPFSEESERLLQDLFEPDRSIGAYDGDEIVGHTGGWTLRMRIPSVPTGPGPNAAPTLGILGVGPVVVLPTHRRRGILRRLMERQLADLHNAGAEPVAALTASEPAIYGRFGYGLATDEISIQLARSRAKLRPVAVSEQLAVRYVEPAKAVDVIQRLHTESTAGRPGSLEHNERWMQRQISDPAEQRDGASVLRCVLAVRDDEPVGYALFRTKLGWTPAGADGTVEVRRVHGLDLASYVALWRFLFDLDLTSQITHPRLSLDDPLFSLLIDIRQAQIRVRDGVWVRLVDVDRALTARTYASDFSVVLEVTDETCPWNAGRWRLSGSPEGATCERSQDAPDVTLDVQHLGAAYLGRPTLGQLGRAGIVEEHTKGALAVLASAFAHDPTPWADTVF